MNTNTPAIIHASPVSQPSMRFISRTVAAVRNSVLTYQNDTPIPTFSPVPVFQPYFSYSAAAGWTPCPKSTLASHETRPLTLRALTWNVDFAAPHAEQRLNGLLEFLESEAALLSSSSAEPRCSALDLICLQEVSASAFPAILNSNFVQNNYYITDIDSTSWHPSVSPSFGSVTLIRRSPIIATGLYGSPTAPRPALRPAAIYRIPFDKSLSHLNRDALCCDILLRGGTRLRVVNVHLDSLNINPPLRPAQLALCAEHLHCLGDTKGYSIGLHAGLVAGDFNAISPRDETLAEECGLVNIWRATHPGVGDTPDASTNALAIANPGDKAEDQNTLTPREDGATWGVQFQEAFPSGRLDRVAVHNLRPVQATVIPCGRVSVTDGGVDKEVLWSDHCGLLVDICLDYSAHLWGEG